MLKVKLLSPAAKTPTVAHPGEDLGYDVYSAETVTLEGRGHAIVSTGIAIECTAPAGEPSKALPHQGNPDQAEVTNAEAR